MSKDDVSDVEQVKPQPHYVRRGAVWGARIGWLLAGVLTVTGLALGKGMSLSSVSLFSAAMTVWTYRDVLDRDIGRAAWAEYLTNIMIALGYAVVVMGLDNDGVGVWIDALAALFLVVFVVRRGLGDRAQLEQERGASAVSQSPAEKADKSVPVMAATVTGGVVLAIALALLRRRRHPMSL